MKDETKEILALGASVRVRVVTLTRQVSPVNFSIMSTQQLKEEAMALPLSERVSLAQALWESINAELADTDEQAAVREAIRRDQELNSGEAVGRTHEQVMQAARRALGCD